MIHRTLSTSVILIVTAAGWSTTQAQSAADSAAIRATALDYIEGWYAGNAERCAFRNDACFAMRPAIVRLLMSRYDGFHQHTLLADQHSVVFYASLGFVRAGSTEAMWIYHGTEH